MRRLIFAAAGLLTAGLIAVPAAASAAPLTVVQTYQDVQSYDFYGSFWVHSTSANNWYQTNNGNQDAIWAGGYGTWQILRDTTESGKCLTFVQSGSQADEVIDETCNSSNPAQEWASKSENHYETTWYFYNQYEIAHDTCAGGHYAFITGAAAVSTLYVECGNSNGTPLDDQQFALYAA